MWARWLSWQLQSRSSVSHAGGRSAVARIIGAITVTTGMLIIAVTLLPALRA
jgi:hypothetical protein